MNKIYITLLTLFLFSACQKTEEKDKLKFSGVYVTDCKFVSDIDNSKQYLRFYPNGKFINATTVCGTTNEDLKKWFHLKRNGSEFLHIGTYKIIENKVELLTVEKNGSVKYTGLLKNNILDLQWKSSITKTSGKEKYQFSKW